MRSVTVRGLEVSVSGDPQRVLTQLLACLLEQRSPRELEARFARGADGFSIPGVVDARPGSQQVGPYRAAADDASEPWTVTMHRAKGEPHTLVVEGDELRALVHGALFPTGSAVGRRNRNEARAIFGVGGAVFVGVTVAMHQALDDWLMVTPLGLVVGLGAAFRVARYFHQQGA